MKIIDRPPEQAKHAVELARRYSNRPELLNPLVRTLDKIHSTTLSDKDDLVVVEGKQARVLTVNDRLTPSDIQTLIDSYRAGATSKKLAERYNFSQTTIKRVLREHGVRKYPRQSA
jgi:transcriptional regulator of aromatic amino acid metabolism